MDIKDKYLKENKSATKDLSFKLTGLMMKGIEDATKEWYKQNIDPVIGFEYPAQRPEVFQKVARDMLDYFKGMEKSSKQELKNLKKIDKKNR